MFERRIRMALTAFQKQLAKYKLLIIFWPSRRTPSTTSSEGLTALAHQGAP